MQQPVANVQTTERSTRINVSGIVIPQMGHLNCILPQGYGTISEEGAERL